jgi:rSAM/selenodomain-associated transferase 2
MISVVIPTLNESNNIAGLLADLGLDPVGPELIVADGGSTDGTPEIAAQCGATVLSVPPGRGAQLRAGAARARGDIILFLHADCRYPKGGLRQIVRVLADHPEALGGNHRLLFDGDDPFSLWLNGFYAWIRSHGVYYGDSGIFVRRGAYDAIGGIRPMALMEDFNFVRRMERHGETVCIDEPPLMTSSRRFEGRHPFAIVYGWLKIHALYYLGLSPARLARIYDSERRADHSPTTVRIASVRDANSDSPMTKGGMT